MDNVPSPIEVSSWQQVVALGLMLTAFVIAPAVLNHLSNRPIKKTLTQNNGGSSVKDLLENIVARLERLENPEDPEIPRALTPPTQREDMPDA
jgi:hypothetical protein